MSETIKIGDCVRVRDTTEIASRPHLQQHARHADIGVVGPPHKQSPGMSALYEIVVFEGCPQHHRMLPEELELVRD